MAMSCNLDSNDIIMKEQALMEMLRQFNRAAACSGQWGKPEPSLDFFSGFKETGRKRNLIKCK